MSEGTTGILLCTNGSELTRPSLKYGSWLAELLKLPVTLLGVVERKDHQHSVERALQETIQHLRDKGIDFQSEIDYGKGTKLISERARLGKFITVVGPLGRPAIKRVVQGRSFRRLLEGIETPMVYVPHLRLPLKHMLICMGGLGFAQSMAQQCRYLAQAVKAQVTLLHVVEHVTMDYPVAKEVGEHWETVLETDTPQGKNLRQALDGFRKAGLTTLLRIRHGNIVHEILDEIRHGDFDLIGLGSPHSSQSLRQYYLPNVSAEVGEAAGLPVLTTRQGYEISLG